MKTVETKVDTFEAVVEMLLPTGQLANVSMSHFLAAHEEFREPIPQPRLREILNVAKNKSDLPKLWLIYRAFDWLGNKTTGLYQEELSIIAWTIEGIVLEELKHPENDTLENSRLLHTSAPHGMESREIARDMFKKHLRAPLDWDKSLDDLIKVRKELRLPPEFSSIGEELNKMIHSKALDGIRLSMKPESKLSYLSMKRVEDGVGLTYEERLSTLREVVEATDNLETLMLAIGHIQLSMVDEKYADYGEKILNRRSEELGHDAWCKVVRLSGNRDFMWRAIEETEWLEGGFHALVADAAMVRLLKDFMTNFHATYEELQKFEKKDNELDVNHRPRHCEFGPLILRAYKHLISNGDKNLVQTVYEEFAGDTKSWRCMIKLAAVRRLYELQKTSQSA